MNTTNPNVLYKQMKLINKGITPSVSLQAIKKGGMRGEREHLIPVGDSNCSITDADKFQVMPLFADLGVQVLPNKGKFLNDDEKFLIDRVECMIELYSSARFFNLGAILHVYEASGDPLSTAEQTFDGNDTLEEVIDTLIPSDGYEHDFFVLTGIQVPFYSNENKWEIFLNLNLTDILSKVIRDSNQGPDPRDRKYELCVFPYTWIASNTIYSKTIKSMVGRIVAKRSSLI